MSLAKDLTPDQAQQTIYSFLRTAYGLPDTIAKIITAQTGHETNGWTSPVYMQLNNVAGFGWDGSSYYGYNSIEESLTDVVNWLSNHVPDFQNITDPDVYAQSLKDNKYYGDTVTNYENGIERWYNDNLQLAAGIGVAVLVGVGLLLYFVFKK